MRLIDADALKKTLEKLWNIHDDQDFCNKDVWREIENAQTVEPERTAKVIRVDRKNFKCLNCGQNFHAYMWAHPTNYCSFCGAKLDWSGMSDLIRREDAINALVEKGQSSKRYKLGDFWELNLSEIKEALDAIPSAEPERKKGKWLEKEVFDNVDYEIPEWQTEKCSVCGKYHTTPYLYNFSAFAYCPNCGSEMTRGEG